MTRATQTAAAPWIVRPFGPWPPSIDVVDAAGRIILIGPPPAALNDDSELRLANALLAAAAPELRAALETAMQLPILGDDAPAWFRQAEAALNKSNGR